MAFAFKRKESVSQAIQRLGCRRLEKAVGILRAASRPESIHAARKQIKKVRALLRLVRSQISHSVYRRRLRALRQAAHLLSPARDAQVQLQTLKSLLTESKTGLTSQALQPLHQALGSVQASPAQQRQRTAQARRILRAEQTHFEKLKIKNRGWAALAPGIRRTYAQGRRRYQKALRNLTPDHLHAWRKRVKDLWYHHGLLRRTWPASMRTTAHELETLSEWLGDDHDLFLLSQTITRVLDARAARILLEQIHQRRQSLQSQAFRLAARLYAEKPTSYGQRQHQYWKLWRSKKPKLKPPHSRP